MRLMKRLDMYLLKAYLQLFAGTFFICLFIFLMQFTWRYVNELIGKGLSTDVLAQFFWYATLTLVPMSLPLALLLAALVTFGNLGERLELLSMKAAGISLVRVLQPVFIFVMLVCIGSYFFQNKVTPEATKQLGALVWSMKQKSPELEIPEGQFYNEIPGYNLFVEHKDTETGMLYGIMIYSTTNGYEDAQIVLADSGKLQSTADRMHLKLTLYGGERFQNMAAQGGQMMRASVPYMRETFNQEVDLIQFDDNFNVLDASLFAGDAATKDINSISRGIDSISHRIDSIGRSIYVSMEDMQMRRRLNPARKDSAQIVAALPQQMPYDSLLAQLSAAQKKEAWQAAATKARQQQSECEFRAMQTTEENLVLRKHRIEWHKKFTLSVACLVFFFIGAPLGAIIRKGGLGLPVVVSVLIFIFYYVVNVSGEKMAKSGDWDITFGVWLSSIVLAPIGVFLTYKSNKDSTMFSIEGYTLPLKRAWKAYKRFSIIRWIHHKIKKWKK
ncbi:MAG: LptF/LptG family permease [Bacteroidales bacterium]|nr:LptF/LptG family permease [Candidatus Physcousia equi]